MGNFCTKEKKYDEAIDKYNKVLINDPKNEICLFNKAFLLDLKGDSQEALKIYEEILNDHPENEEVKMGLGLCYYKLKDYDNAIKQFDLILEKDPDNYDALYNKAICYYEKNEKTECEDMLKQLNKKLKMPMTFLSQGLICLKDQKYDNGIKKFESVISRDKDNIYAHHGRGQCLYEKGKIEEAINSYDEALNINPE